MTTARVHPGGAESSAPGVLDDVGRLLSLAKLAGKLRSVQRAETPERARAAAGDVASRLADLGGLPQKIGQLFALPDLSDTRSPFHALTEGAPVLTEEEALAEIERSLGAPARPRFRRFDARGISASLSQVHRATLLDGRDVAVKVQLPFAARAAGVDAGALRLLAVPGGWKRRLDLLAYRVELARNMSEELDYRHEGRNAIAFDQMTAGWEDVVIPKVESGMTRERLLVMDWIDGEGFGSVRRWSARDRRKIGHTLASLFLRGCLRWKLLHADPHPGNYRFIRGPGGPRVGVLDFGCVRQIPVQVSDGLRALVESARRGPSGTSAEDALMAYAAAGFDPELLGPMAQRLPALTRALFEPFARAGEVSLAGFRPWEGAAAALGDLRSNFRLAGAPSVLFLMRAYRGLVSYLTALDVPLDLGRAYEEAADGPPVSALPEPSFPRVAQFSEKTRGGATVLRVSVRDSGRRKVDLTFRALMVRHLEDLVPEEIAPELRKRGVDLDHISRAAVAAGVPPGELWSLTEGHREIRVWLE